MIETFLVVSDMDVAEACEHIALAVKALTSQTHKINSVWAEMNGVRIGALGRPSELVERYYAAVRETRVEPS